jgi:hypothetical protein
MELGIRTRSTAAVLSSISAAVQGRRDLLVEEWQGIVEWADANQADSLEGAAMIAEGSYLDTGVPIAGPGAPLVSEFGLMELIAVLEGPRTAGARTSGGSWSAPGVSPRPSPRWWRVGWSRGGPNGSRTSPTP